MTDSRDALLEEVRARLHTLSAHLHDTVSSEVAVAHHYEIAREAIAIAQSLELRASAAEINTSHLDDVSRLLEVKCAALRAERDALRTAGDRLAGRAWHGTNCATMLPSTGFSAVECDCGYVFAQTEWARLTAPPSDPT